MPPFYDQSPLPKFDNRRRQSRRGTLTFQILRKYVILDVEMSLAIAIQTKEGIVIASDSRGTFGDPRGVTGANDTIQKLYGLSKHTAVAVAGANEIGATLLDLLFPIIQERHADGIVDEMLKGNQSRTKRLKKLFFGNKRVS